MNEAETRAEQIDPALKAAGWGVAEGSKVSRKFSNTHENQRNLGNPGNPGKNARQRFASN